jgi:glycosyltransferase involved in cell wall biosynthesis
MAGWSLPTTSRRWADAMVTAIDNPDERMKRGGNAYRHARDRYSWRDVARRVTDLYETHAPG